MEMTSLMTGFILNGLSESLLSSRLFRIKAWVLQVPFLSMIFLYFFDHSNLNHSKVFYLFLYLLKICMANLTILAKFLILFLSDLFLFGLSLCLFYPKPLSKMTHPLWSLPSSVSGTTIIYFCSYLVVSSFLISRVNGVYAQKTATPFNSGITVCNL